MAGVYVSFDFTKLEAWIERARSASSRSAGNLAKAFHGIEGEMMTDFSQNLPSFMEQAGLGHRSGRMARETTIKILRITSNGEGGEMVVKVSGPNYVMIHETGGVITPKTKQYLRVPFLSERGLGTHSMSSASDDAMADRTKRVVTAGKGFFVMARGKGGKQLKFPLLMERFPAVEGGERNPARKRHRQAVKALHGTAHYKNMTGEEKAEANAFLSNQYKHELEEAQPEAFPVASLRKNVFMPRRPWLSLAVQHFNSKLDTSVSGTQVIYGNSGFEYDFKWAGK